MTAAHVRAATPDDVGPLGIVGPAACAEAYGSFWQLPGAFAAHLATFGPAYFVDLMARPDAHVWVGEVDGTVVGYAVVLLNALDPVERRAGGAELSRLYLLGPARVLGLGRQLLEAATARARRDGATHLWLEAMEAADWALRAYEAWGFRAIGRTRFEKPVRPGLDGMIVMARDLA